MVCNDSSDTLSSESGKRVKETPLDFSGDGELRTKTQIFPADFNGTLLLPDTNTS